MTQPIEFFYPTIKDCLSFVECQESIKFHSENIKNAEFDTTFLLNRIESIEAIIELLKTYDRIAKSKKYYYISTTKGIRGYFSVMIEQNYEMYEEPFQSGFNSYKTIEKAIVDAKDWAKSENLKYLSNIIL
jgi:hypothetical protein